MNFQKIRNDKMIKSYIYNSDRCIQSLGYTEHGFRHVDYVSNTAAKILSDLGYDENTIDCARIAGTLHDIGNMVNRHEHSQSGAIMAFIILTEFGLQSDEISLIVSSIGNHDQLTGSPVNEVAAAIIIADKTDITPDRVVKNDLKDYDIHDKVNYSVNRHQLTINREEHVLIFELEMNSEYCSMKDFFDIFSESMIFVAKAAATLGLTFKLIINNKQYIYGV